MDLKCPAPHPFELKIRQYVYLSLICETRFVISLLSNGFHGNQENSFSLYIVQEQCTNRRINYTFHVWQNQ